MRGASPGRAATRSTTRAWRSRSSAARVVPFSIGNADFFERPGLVRGLENILMDVLVNPRARGVPAGPVRLVLHRRFLPDDGGLRAGRSTSSGPSRTWGPRSGFSWGRDAMERFIFTPLRKMAEVVHREGVKLMFHSCGAVREVIPELIACGVDILNPLQPAGPGHGARRTEEGLRSGHRLPRRDRHPVPASPRKPREGGGGDAKGWRACSASGGGYVLSPSHNIQLDTPTANILAMYRPEARQL